MDYLRTLGSAAVSSLVQKSGLNLPFSLGSKVAYEGVWNLYEGTKREDGSHVSVFEFDATTETSKKNFLPLAKNALRKLRTTRHPDVLKFMDVVETDTTIHIMTERVRPLGPALLSRSSSSQQEREDWLLWGLHRVSVALAFVNDSCASTHGNIRIGSIFITPSGEWKLGGFEVLSNPKDPAAVLYTMGGSLPDSSSLSPPEVKKGGWSVLKEHDVAAADAYALGLLLHALFNPNQPLPATVHPPHPPPQPSSRGSIPASLFPHFKKLLNPNPKARMTPKHFLDIGMAETGFFATNRLVKVCLGLDNFALSSEAEKSTLLRTLKESASSFPTEFASFRVLPSLVSALEYGGASAATILPLVLKFGENVASEEYPKVILTPLVKLFASPDRGTRMALLDHLPEYAERLDKKMVNDQIWPNLQTGFSDTVAVIREATVKSISLLAPKFSDRILNNDLLRFLARMQTDVEASIRTNTCILIGRLGPSLGYNTKRKVLVPAFSRALKDTFVHARVAGLMALMATIDCYEPDDLASKVIPSMSFTMLDKEKLVRDQAFKAMELFVKKLETHASTLPETVAPQETLEMPGGLGSVAIPTQATIVNSAAGAAGALAGWAITSLGKKLAASDLQSTIAEANGPATAIDRSSSAPFTAGPSAGSNGPQPNGQTLTPPGPERSSSAPNQSKGLKLGSAKAHADDSFIAELEKDSSHDSNPWAAEDLMDVNADQDDWSAFESAPAPVINLEITNDLGFDVQDPWEHQDPVPPKPRSFSSSTPPSVKPLSVARTVSSLSDPAGRDEWGAFAIKPNVVAEAKTTISVPNTPLAATMSKEDRAAEMARRKEERRQRIAMLKEKKQSKT
ncbi:hypothetical protein PC9H_007689 [Pleurotus ostreatus]|uniref:Protein kinase domain-containing protein n=1 Tax=Pleurotus ostreatus TaxID=5322 RepID=A0A8H7DT00_PLEOS|nr:uncharacterized protein PC9H_007689 [Pleurotus ostreatus]KAF7428465.1 hypothetical protein PC9H_007689 [Pleurotus ostreatus]KAJ8696610.1 Nuclear aminoacylation-dependent tRNA export pathway component [Pleurotus ostreatus]